MELDAAVVPAVVSLSGCDVDCDTLRCLLEDELASLSWLWEVFMSVM